MRAVGSVLLACAALLGCACTRSEPPAPAPGSAEAPAADPFEERVEDRRRLVEELGAQGIADPRVLAAVGRVPRHVFVPERHDPAAYANRPLPIGAGQTISQPYVVALMTEALELEPGDRVLEVGTGSGYQAAVLAELGARVWSIEIVEELAERAALVLDRLGYSDRVETRVGDGWAGWPEAAPFDAILVTAAPDELPQALLDQLAPGGRLVVPVGEELAVQDLLLVRKRADGSLEQRSLGDVRFVPMTGGEDR